MDLNYPIIAFAKNNVVYFARDSDDLTICSRKGLKNGFYNNLVIIDCTGNKYEIQNAQKIGTGGFFFGLNILHGQKLRIKLNFSNKVEKLKLADFKGRINKVFINDIYFWNSDGGLIEKKSFINNARNFREIIEYLTGEFYKKY